MAAPSFLPCGTLHLDDRRRTGSCLIKTWLFVAYQEVLRAQLELLKARRDLPALRISSALLRLLQQAVT